MSNTNNIKILETIQDLIVEDLVGYDEEIENLKKVISDLRSNDDQIPSGRYKYFSYTEEIKPGHIKTDLYQINIETFLSKYIHYDKKIGVRKQAINIQVFDIVEDSNIIDKIRKENDQLLEISFSQYKNIYSNLSI